MTEEERERQMNFILNQQALFAAGIQKLQESQARSEGRLDRLERIARLMVRAGLRARRQMREQNENFAAQKREQDERIAALVDSQMHTEEIVRRNSEAIRENSAAIRQLTEVVRQIASRQNDGEEVERLNAEARGVVVRLKAA